jgi:hypothetical protein
MYVYVRVDLCYEFGDIRILSWAVFPISARVSFPWVLHDTVLHNFLHVTKNARILLAQYLTAHQMMSLYYCKGVYVGFNQSLETKHGHGFHGV